MNTLTTKYPLLKASICLLLLYISIRSEIVPISPEEGAFVNKNEFIGIFSYLADENNIKKVRLFFDNFEISNIVRITGSTISFIPDQTFLARTDIEGPHIFTILIYGRYREIIERKYVRFYIVNDVDATSREQQLTMIEKGLMLTGVKTSELSNSGKVYLNAEFDKSKQGNKFKSEIDASGTGSYQLMRYNYNLYLNSDEDAHFQTLHRFRVNVSYSNFTSIGIGDNYPSYHQMVLNDCRVRGLELRLKTPNNIAGLDFVIGWSQRAVNPYIFDNKAFLDGVSKDTGIFSHNDSLPFLSEGTYKRTVLGTHLYFGTGQKFKLGISLLKSRDDTSSITSKFRVIDSGDVIVIGATPKDNIAAGIDITAHFLKRHLSLFGNYAISVVTKNILGGPFGAEDIRNMSDGAAEVDLKPWENILIINATTVPIPLTADTNGSAIAGSILSCMAWDAGAKVNIPLPLIKSTSEFIYYYHGPNYFSVGNDRFTADRQGIRISEEIIWKTYISLKTALDYYQNNLFSIKSGTTNTLRFTLTGSASISPQLPRLSFRFTNSSDRTEMNDTLPYSTSRKSSIGTTGISLYQSFKLGSTSHTASINYDYNNSQYSLPAVYKDQSNILFFAFKNQFEGFPLQSRFQFASNTGNTIRFFSAAAGLTWLLQPNVMYADFDIGRDYSQISKEESNSLWKINSSYNYDFSKRHSFYIEAGSSFPVGQTVKPHGKLSYEFRY